MRASSMLQLVWELSFTISQRTPKPIPLWTPKDRELQVEIRRWHVVENYITYKSFLLTHAQGQSYGGVRFFGTYPISWLVDEVFCGTSTGSELFTKLKLQTSLDDGGMKQ